MNAVDMVPMCRTVAGVSWFEPDESSDTSRTDTAELEESDIEDCGLWTDLWEDKDCPLCSEGLRQWNMHMDVEYQYETFNGLPVYYGGDMYDSEDTEEYDPLEMAHAAYVEDYNFDVKEGMELMTYTRRLPDGGDAGA